MKTENTRNISVFLRKSRYGFTLVELIVVITILVILGTIAFMSLVGYSMSARDSSRISDLDNISKALELTKTKTGRYPAPSSYTGVTFSGGTVWYQGTVGESVVNIVNAAGFELSKKPTDPKYPTVEYTYSVLENNKEYQVSAAMEESSTAMNPIITPVYAEENALFAYIKGNYNGAMATSKTAGGDICILALPSIILQDVSSASGTILNSGDPIQKNNLVLNKKSNLPGSYTNNAVTTASGEHFVYTPLQNGNSTNAGSGLTVYCSGSLPSNTGSLATVTNNLKTIYGSSGLSTDSVSAPWIADFLASPTQNAAVANVLRMSLGGTNIAGVTDAPVAGGGGGGGTPPPVAELSDADIAMLETLQSDGWIELYAGNTWLPLPFTRESLNTVTHVAWWTDTPILPWFYSRSNLTYLEIYSSTMTTLPEEVGNLTSLTYLSLNGSQVTTLPSTIGNLTNLTNLQLSYNQLNSLPSTIGSLTKLTSLQLGNNQFTSFPTEIASLTNLTSLSLSNNQITTLPSAIGNLTKLTNLSLDGNPSLWELASSFYVWSSLVNRIQPWIPSTWNNMLIWGNETNLTISVIADGNLFVSCNPSDPEIATLNTLRSTNKLYLYRDYNSSYVLPTPFTRLSLCYNTNTVKWLGWSAVAPEIFKLTQSLKFDLSSQNITSLPAGLWTLTNLRHLFLTGNPLITLPSGIWNLANLTKLDVAWSQLTSLPPELWTLTNLTFLRVSNNPLTTLPSGIGNLTNLKDLWADATGLTTLPSTMTNLTKLTYLMLSGNTGLWQLNFVFWGWSAPKSQSGIPEAWKTMTIWGNSTNVTITVTTP